MSTALSAAWRYHRVIVRAAKVLKFAAERINESSPQERGEIGRRIQAIYEILRNAARRKGEELDPQPLAVFVPPPAPGGFQPDTGRNRRRQRVRESIGQILRALKKYRLSMTRAELAEIGDHLKEIGRLVSEIDRRVRANAKSS